MLFDKGIKFNSDFYITESLKQGKNNLDKIENALYGITLLENANVEIFKKQDKLEPNEKFSDKLVDQEIENIRQNLNVYEEDYFLFGNKLYAILLYAF